MVSKDKEIEFLSRHSLAQMLYHASNYSAPVPLWDGLWKHIFLCNLADKKIGRTELFTASDFETPFKNVSRVAIDTPIINHSRSNTIDGGQDLINFGAHNVVDHRIAAELTRASPIVMKLLEIGQGHLSLCGGAVLRAMTNCNVMPGNEQYYNDFDFFFHTTVEDADRVLNECLEYIESLKLPTCYTKNQGVITCDIRGSGLKIQFIKRLYQTKDQILLGFDMPGCQYGYNITDGIFTTLQGLFAFVTASYPADMTQRCTTYNTRLLKYADKGFRIMLPGLGGRCTKFTNNKCIFTPTKDFGVYTMRLQDNKEILFSDYQSEVFGIETLFKYPSMFEFCSITCEGITNLDDETVRSSLERLNGYHLPKAGTVKPRDKLFLGDRLAAFVIENVIKSDASAAEEIWKLAQQDCIEKARDLAAHLNTDLRWKVDNPGCQHFGKFNPIPANPKEWYGGRYEPVVIGIEHERFQAWMDCRKNIQYIANLSSDLFKLVCQSWFDAEVEEARSHLDKYLY